MPRVPSLCSHDCIDATIEIGPACSTIHLEPGMSFPDDPPGVPLRFIALSDLRCMSCGKALSRHDVGRRFERGGDLYHPRFAVSFAR
jgi:hypothetical protein